MYKGKQTTRIGPYTNCNQCAPTHNKGIENFLSTLGSCYSLCVVLGLVGRDSCGVPKEANPSNLGLVVEKAVVLPRKPTHQICQVSYNRTILWEASIQFGLSPPRGFLHSTPIIQIIFNPSLTTPLHKGNETCRVYTCRLVWGGSISSNLLKPLHFRGNKVYIIYIERVRASLN